ncbi:zn 2cys6 transcription factor [Phlyctema vagabunda]|uniref:Zn 2cys6 transcription factor n=1 Tax=Phlyctema vagabunda TaxID=108571 RepID=A0ABR4PPB7_9HELO
MADTPGDPKSRNARACEACRASKSRCIFKEQQTVCQRCEQNASQCVVRAKARPRRVRAAVKGTTTPDTAELPSNFSFSLPPITAPDVKGDVAALRSHHDVIFGADVTLGANYDNTPMFKSSSTEAASGMALDHLMPAPQVIKQRKVTLKEASVLLDSFRTRAVFFPFVVVPSDATVQSLARTSPFLLLAILTSSDIKDPYLHHQLDHEFRQVLSMKVIVEGQKSLDYLMGLLVYTAWYPFHSKPRNNQTFMYLNLATSLAVDLGLDRELPSHNFKMGDIRTEGLVDGYIFTKAARRAYLGCYYLYSSFAMGFHKENNFKYTDLMTIHAESLRRDEIPSDVTLYALLGIQRITERVGQSSSATKPPVVDASLTSINFDMNVQIFQNELQEWRASTPTAVLNTPLIGLAERFIGMCIYSHELGSLRRPYQHAEQVFMASGSPDSPSHLNNCLNAAKRYFEYLLAIPESHYPELTATLWGNIVQSILTLSRLTFLMASLNGWDPETTRATIPLGMYLDCLCYRIQSLSQTFHDPNAKALDVMHIFKLILSSVKQSYEQRVSNIKPNFFFVENGVAVGAARGHCPIFDPNLRPVFQANENLMEDIGSSSASASGSGSSSGIGGSGMTSAGDWTSLEGDLTPGQDFHYDIWSTMTSNWAAEF